MRTFKYFFLITILWGSCTSQPAKSPAESEPQKDTTQVEPFKPKEGSLYLDLKFPAMNGTEVSLSEYVSSNKLTIVDCWASWCGPCMAEMPNLVQIYKKYHSNGLEIVGISFDKEQDAWMSAVQKQDMQWPQLSELNGWENQMMEKYDVQSIPCTFLISQDGIIQAIGLRGTELEEKVKSYLGL